VPASLKLLVDVVLPVFAVILVGGLVGGWFRLDVRHVDRLALYAAYLIVAAGLALGLTGLDLTGLDLTGLDLSVLVLMGAMPTAVNAVMLAIEFGGDAEQVGDMVVAGTALALVTLPLVLSVLTTAVDAAPG